jgi:hypothetical protein
MRWRFGHRGAGRATPADSSRPIAAENTQNSPSGIGQRACCCPAPPVVQVMMPHTAERPYPVDPWLCGHHYRVCQDALACAGAMIQHLPGRADLAAMARFDVADRSRADVIWR